MEAMDVVDGSKKFELPLGSIHEVDAEDDFLGLRPLELLCYVRIHFR